MAQTVGRPPHFETEGSRVGSAIKRATTGGAPAASYVRADGRRTPRGTIADKTLLEVFGMVMDRPMTATVIAVAVVEAGYQSTMSRKIQRNHDGVELRRGGFVGQGGRWSTHPIG